MPSLVLLAFGLLTTLHLFIASDGEITASGAYQSGRPLLYVASLSGEVTAYNPGSSGLVSPVRQLTGPIAGLTDSWAVAFDTAGDLFVQNFLGDSTTDVFAPDVNGDTALGRYLRTRQQLVTLAVSWLTPTAMSTSQG
jgi:hypothetical protein